MKHWNYRVVRSVEKFKDLPPTECLTIHQVSMTEKKWTQTTTTGTRITSAAWKDLRLLGLTMPKRLISIRISARTDDQIKQLAEKLGTTQAEVVARAIEEFYRSIK